MPPARQNHISRSVNKILVLGSEGFIGSHTVTHFKSRGYQVTSADIVLKQSPDYLLVNPELPNFAGIFMQHQFDACINATGAANVQLSFNHPGMDYSLNVANVYAILDSIRQYNPTCKFLNLSSAAVFGNPAELPLKETSPLKPVSPYGYHKMYSEQVCREFYELFNVPTLNARIFSAYGEGLKKQLFWDLYKKIENADGQVEMFGTGKESRDFIYIKDLVFALECMIKGAEFNGQAVNTASGKESTIEEAVGYFVRAFEKKIAIKFSGNAKIGDPVNWRADISLLRTMGFKNEFSLEAGINNYCKWVQEKRSL
jgi:UDP-glucose 4-epimerase